MKTAFVIAASAAILAAALPAAAAPHGIRPGLAFEEPAVFTVADRGRDKDRGWGRGQGRSQDRGSRGRGGGQGRSWSPPPNARAWGRGDFLPPTYRGQGLSDFGRYRLRPPPAGYDWVQVGRDIYLMQRSTGMVLEAIPYGY